MPADAGDDEAERLLLEKDLQLARIQLAEEHGYEYFGQESTRLANALLVQRSARGNTEEQISTRLQQVRNVADAAILRERQERHGVETRLERLADAQTAELQGFLADGKALEQDSVLYAKEICDEVCGLYRDIDQARKYRLEKGQKLGEGIRYKLDEVRDAVEAERRIRLESQDTLLELFGQMGQKMEQEMEHARRERLLTTDRFLALVETVLPKLEELRKKNMTRSTA